MVNLSASSLKLFIDCPRCFWLQLNGKRRPSGPMSTMPQGADLIIKSYFDHHRPELPPAVIGKIEGQPVDQEQMNKLRKYVKFSPEEGFVLRGLFDECFILNNKFIPVDYKTRGFAVKEIHPSYQFQLNIYALLLKENGLDPADFGYLVYFVLDRESSKITELHNGLPVNVSVHKLNTDPESARDILKKAIECLKNKVPEKHEECAYCNWE